MFGSQHFMPLLYRNRQRIFWFHHKCTLLRILLHISTRGKMANREIHNCLCILQGHFLVFPRLVHVYVGYAASGRGACVQCVAKWPWRGGGACIQCVSKWSGGCVRYVAKCKVCTVIIHLIRWMTPPEGWRKGGGRVQNIDNLL